MGASLSREPLMWLCLRRPEKEERAPADMEFTENLVRSDLCAFMSAYHTFLPEALVAVKSIQRFMPGMRVAIAVHPSEFSVFNRYAGHHPCCVIRTGRLSCLGAPAGGLDQSGSPV